MRIFAPPYPTMLHLSTTLHRSLTEDVIARLCQKRVVTIVSFLETDSELLAKLSGLQFRHVLAIKDSIITKYASKVIRGDQYYKEVLSEGAILPTGIGKLDEVLQGGLHTGALYELCGTSSTGKSQICMLIAANVSFTCQQNVFYIDTKDDLSSERLISFLQPKTTEVGESLQRILVSQSRTTYQLLNCLHEHISQAKRRRVRLLVVDSLAALFYQHLGDHKEGIGFISNVTNLLKYIAVELHTAVLLTNLSTSWQGTDSDEVQKAAMGRFWSHVPTVRFAISRLRGSSIVLTVTKSSSLPIGSSVTLSLQEDNVQ